MDLNKNFEFSNKLVEIQTELELLDKTIQSLNFEVDLATFSPNPDRLTNVAAHKYDSAIHSIRDFRELIQSGIEEQIDVRDSKSFIGHFLMKLNLKCPDDFLTTLSKDKEIIEAYSLENVQIFRNFTFMKVCGYSLADILTYEWPDLFERSNVVTQGLLEKVHAVVGTKETQPLDTQTHYMKERFSDSKRIHKVDFRHIAPLLDQNDNIAGYVASSRAQIIDKAPDNSGLRFI